MNNFFRAIIAGYGAKKLGGGCFGTILVFVLIWVALGQCSFSSRAVPAPETYPADRRVHLQPQTTYNDIFSSYAAQTNAEETIIEGIGVIDIKYIKQDSRLDASIFPSRKIYLSLYCISFS
jgi:hypothetical protein